MKNSRMRLVKYVFAILLLFCFNGILLAGGLHFNSRSITMADGLPSNCINAIEQDAFGLIWIGTNNGLCSYDGFSVYDFVDMESDRLSLNLKIANITNDREGTVMRIDMPGSPFIVIDQKTNKVVSVEAHRKKISQRSPYYVEDDAVFQDSTRHYRFWLNKDGDLWVVEKANQDVTHSIKLRLLYNMRYTGNRRQKFHIVEDDNGLLYMASYGNGLFVYDTKNRTLQHFTSNDITPIIQSDFLSCILLDKSGCIWVGSESAGLVCMSQSDINVRYIYPIPKIKGGWENAIHALCKTSDNNLLFSDFTGKLYKYSIRQERLESVFQSRSAIYSILFDQKGNRWLGTRGGGLYVNDINFSTSDRKHYLMTNEIESLVEDWNGNVWFVSSNSGLVMARYDRSTNRIDARRFLREESGHWISGLYVDDSGTLWIGSVKGLFALRTGKAPLGSGSFEHYDTYNCGLKSNQITSILQVSENRLWVGVGGHGITVLDMRKNGVKAVAYINRNNGFTHDNVIMMMKDSNGKVVATTEKGISVIDPVTMKVVTYHCTQDPQGDNFVGCNGILGNDGTVYLGTYNGVACVSDNVKLQRNTLETCLITDLKINGSSIRSLKDDVLSDSVVMLAKKITLNHSQNNLQFSFTDFNYAKEYVSLFQYYLEGMEKTWNSPSNGNVAIYQNLSPGKYIFHLRMYGSDKETILTIRICQPWYNTWLAWIFYIAVFTSVIYYLYNQWRRNFNLKQEMKMQKELMQFRINFFTQISHEFRTPLSIIQNSVQYIMDSKGERVSKSALQTVKRSSQRLMKLINQLIEFRKIQTDGMRLNLMSGDVVAKVHKLVDDFQSIAHLMGINLYFTSFAKSYDMTFSPEFVETIVTNLISNALKYTPSKGSVKVTVRVTDNHTISGMENDTSDAIPSSEDRKGNIVISVSDSGPGISKEGEKHLFQPFMHGYISKGGMGIGLYIAHKMAEIHHGTLSYCKSEELGGAMFTLTLPTDDSIYDIEDYASATSSSNTLSTDGEASGYKTPVIEPLPNAMNMLRVAIIEDDVDLMQQMCSEIRRYFMVDSYMNGKDGYDGVIANSPDLILCDVMLPGMNGYDIVKKIKMMPSMKCVPVIMLTALDDEEHQIKGYEAGADDYMVKPCNYKVLIARMAQLINWKKRNDTSMVAREGKMEKTGETVILKEADKVLKERIETIVMRNFADADFSVETMAEKLHLGSTKLFGKTKELMGMTPAKYILNIRMKKAAEMLLEGEHDIYEISLSVGFRDPSYFNKCFKSVYGKSPSKYGK